MNKITITKSVTRTYNLGNFENYKPMISISKEVEGGDVDIQKELDEMTKILDAELAKEKEKVKK